MLSHDTPSRTSKKYYGKDTRANGPPRQRPVKTGQGAFIHGIWQCDCSPRLPAEHFMVKKEGKNKGKWFYTCQLSNKDGATRGGCGFFLWQDAAQMREQSAVLGNSRSEPRSTSEVKGVQHVQEPGTISNVIEEDDLEAKLARLADCDYDDDSTDDEAAPSPSKRKADSINTNMKRTASAAGFDDRSTRSTDSAILAQTPRKAMKMSNGYMTPADTVGIDRNVLFSTDEMAPIAPIQLKSNSRLDQLLTPRTPRASMSIGVMPVTPQTAASLMMPPEAEVTTPTKQLIDPLTTPPGAPQAQRYHDAARNSDASDSQLAKDVMAELSDVLIPAPLEQRLHDILSSYETRAEGVKRGRDICRTALADRDKTIGALKTEIAALQAKVRAARNAALIGEMQTHNEPGLGTVGQRLRS